MKPVLWVNQRGVECGCSYGVASRTLSGHSFGDAVEGHLSSLAVTLAVLTHAGLTDN